MDINEATLEVIHHLEIQFKINTEISFQPRDNSYYQAVNQ